MITMGTVDLALVDYVESAEHLESLFYYDRDLYWTARGKDGKLWLGVWQDTDWAPLPAVDQEAFFEVDEGVVEALKTKPIVEVLRSAKSVILRNYYFTPYVQEPGRYETCTLTVSQYMEEAEATGGLPKPDVILFT